MLHLKLETKHYKATFWTFGNEGFKQRDDDGRVQVELGFVDKKNSTFRSSDYLSGEHKCGSLAIRHPSETIGGA